MKPKNHSNVYQANREIVIWYSPMKKEWIADVYNSRDKSLKKLSFRKVGRSDVYIQID